MKHLLEHFTTLSLHPKNAFELKGLILQLAIQGKLTAKWRKENPNVEYASVLLERIKEEKAYLVTEKKIRKEKPLPKITEGENPYELPEAWVWCNLGEAGVTQTGNTPPKKHPNYYGDFIPFLGPANITNSCMEYPVSGLSELGLEKGRFIPKGSLMMVCIGGSIGKCNLNEIDVSCNQQINIITPVHIESRMLKIICQSPYFQNEVKEDSYGLATPMISKGKWEIINIPLPPLEEQKAIVEVVNQLFKEVEQLESLTKDRIQLKKDFVTSALQQLTTGDTPIEWKFLHEHFSTFFTEQRNVNKLRESILQLAVQGKLTKHWRSENPDVEDAAVLLERIKEEKAQLIADKKIRKEKPLPEITEDEIPYKLPEGWVWCRLGEVTDIIAGASFKSGDFNDKAGVKCIKITNAGVRSFVETNDYLPKDFIDQYPNYLIKEGDLILALTRPYIKAGLKISVCPATYHNSLLNQRVASIRSITNLLHHAYIFTFIQSPRVLSYYKSKFDRKSQQPNMKMGDITDLIIALPPVEEQKTLLKKVNSLLDLCDKLEQEIQTSKAIQEDWMKSSLREVFENVEAVTGHD